MADPVRIEHVEQAPLADQFAGPGHLRNDVADQIGGFAWSGGVRGAAVPVLDLPDLRAQHQEMSVRKHLEGMVKNVDRQGDAAVGRSFADPSALRVPAADHPALPVDLGDQPGAGLGVKNVSVAVAADILGRCVELEIETDRAVTVECDDPANLGFLIADAAGPGGQPDQPGLAPRSIADVDPQRRPVVLTH